MGAQWQNTIVPAPAAGTARQCGFSALLSKNHHREVVTVGGERGYRKWEEFEALHAYSVEADLCLLKKQSICYQDCA